MGLLLPDRLEGAPSPYSFAPVLLALALLSLPDLEVARALIAAYSPVGPPWYVALLLAAPTAGMLLLWRTLAVRLCPPGTNQAYATPPTAQV
jgi:UPF0716 family protein affecting phage T7 exclusion